MTSESRHLAHHEEEVMGTVVTVDLYGDDELAASGVVASLLDAACGVLHEADDVFSTWREDTPISRVRRGELAVDAAPPVVGAVLRCCREIRELSSGWFDPWAMPTGVDPSGYVKGWAAQQALARLSATGVHGAIVNAAGDIATFGSPSAGRRFRVGIVDPFDRVGLACVVEVDGAIATSGAYERGAHLVDPQSGKRCCAVASASVCGPDLGLADALATALAVSGNLDVVRNVEGCEGLVIDHDGRRRATRGFPFAEQMSAARH